VKPPVGRRTDGRGIKLSEELKKMEREPLLDIEKRLIA